MDEIDLAFCASCEDGTTGPAPPVRPVRPWPYQFLRRKNGVAGILTYECVASYIQSFHLEASAGQSRDHKARTDCSM